MKAGTWKVTELSVNKVNMDTLPNMKTKFNIFLASILSILFVSEAFSQLKVLPNGCVGIGTNNPLAPLHTIGSIRISGVNGHVLRLHSNNLTPEIGSSQLVLNF